MAASYGDVIGEIRSIDESVAVVPNGFELVWVEGPDAVSFLQGLISQDIAGRDAGSVTRSLLLAPQGKLRAVCWVLVGSDEVGLVVDAGWAPRVIEDLTTYRIRVKVSFRNDERPVHSLWGPNSAELVGGCEPATWRDVDDVLVAAIPMPGVDRILVAGDVAFDATPQAGELATTAHRVAAGEPVFGRDIDESTIPQESGLVPVSVSFTKGCYLGQELVARIDSRGHVNRVLRSLAITRNVLPPEGAEVFSGDRLVGRITSVAEAMDSPVGLILLRREVEPGDEVEVRWESGSVPAIVRAVPPRD